MRRGERGVIASARRRPLGLATGLAALAGAAGLGGVAQAAELAEAAAAPTEVSGVDVNGRRGGLDSDIGLAIMPTTVQDTPQAVSVIDAVQLKAQGVASLEQALRNVPGITVAIGEGGQLNGDQFKIRGFEAKDDVYVDGLRDFGAYSRDSFAYEEVQILKGPSGAMFGRGTTGGAINTISKSPKLRDFATVDGYLGSGSYKRALADVNHQLGDTTAVRVNLMWNDNKVVDRDLIYNKKWGAAVAAGFGIGTNTQFTLNYVHQHWKGRPDYGVERGVRRQRHLQDHFKHPVGHARSVWQGLRAHLHGDRTLPVLDRRHAHRQPGQSGQRDDLSRGREHHPIAARGDHHGRHGPRAWFQVEWFRLDESVGQ